MSRRFLIFVDETLEHITQGAAVRAVPGITCASISVTTRDGKIQTLAPTDELAEVADELQY
ncbi:hypothetical protein ACGFIF_17245 [Kribbella sp. NPDC049174]|uniref:hypothetical protein n=1 Tax=Kribbella sp. NPDC049174 TaxID=3364112 RepID=UPI00371D8289